MRTLLLGCLALVACSVPVPEVGPTSSTVVTTSSTLPAATTTTAASATTTTTVAPALAGVTPTGVIVPIRAEGAGRYVVGTPCASSVVIAADDLTRLDPVEVLLDPGHGGDIETGSVGPNGVREADLNLDVARRLQEWLDEHGIPSALTRDGDYRMAIAARVELATALQPRLFVSIHHNAGSIAPADQPGTIVFHQHDDPESRRAAGLAYEEMLAVFEPLDLPWVNSLEPGAFAAIRATDGLDAYGVLRRNPVPAILTEALFLQNAAEAEALATDEVQVLEVEALGRAIERFLTTADTGSGLRDAEVYDFPVSATGGTAGCVDPDLGV